MPVGSIGRYKNTGYWKDFLNIVEDSNLDIYYKAIVTSNSGGSIDAGGAILNGLVKADTPVTFTFIPETEKYELNQVKLNGVEITGDVLLGNNRYTIESVASDIELSGVFKQISPKVTITGGLGGIVQVGKWTVYTIENGTKSFAGAYGESYDFKVIPLEGCAISKIQMNKGVLYGYDATKEYNGSIEGAAMVKGSIGRLSD